MRHLDLSKIDAIVTGSNTREFGSEFNSKMRQPARFRVKSHLMVQVPST